MAQKFTIIGGGIAGLTTAIALNKIGIKATIMEAAPEFKPVGAGITLAYNAMKAFRHLNIIEDITTAANPLSAFEIFDEHGKTIIQPEIDYSEKSIIYAIHRAELHKVLLSHLQDHSILTGTRMIGFEKQAGRFLLSFDDGSTHSTDILIGADGIHSSIRNQALPDSKIRYAGYTCWRGITENTFGTQKATETWGSNGRFGVVPLANDQIYWFSCKKAPSGDEQMSSFGPKEIYRIFKEYHEPIGKIIDDTPEEHIIWNDIYDLKPIRHFAFGNLVLIGDAAHATTPNMGQGACQAIEDAVVLAECLKNTSSADKAFRKFERKRIKRTHYIVKQSRNTGKVAQLENKLLSSVRNRLFRMVPSSTMKKQMEKLFEVEFCL